MAHECPHCGCTCHCGGDIDDICFSGTPEEAACRCCEDDYLDGEDDEDYYDRQADLGDWPDQS